MDLSLNEAELAPNEMDLTPKKANLTLNEADLSQSARSEGRGGGAGRPSGRSALATLGGGC